MARGESRIPLVLEELEEYWQENPDLRLAQIVSNIAKRKGYGNDPFYMEDSELLRELMWENDREEDEE